MVSSDSDTAAACPFRSPLGQVLWEESGWFLGQPVAIIVDGRGLVRVDQGQEKEHLPW